MSRRFTPEEITFIKQTHATMTIAQQAKALGRSYRSVRQWRDAARKRREFSDTERFYRPAWSDQRHSELVRLIQSGLSIREVETMLGMGKDSVRSYLARKGISIDELRSRPGMRVRTPRQVAQLFGVSLRVVQTWIQRNHIESKQERASQRVVHFICDYHIQNFMENVQTWPIWKPELVTEPQWKEYALWARSRAQGHWVSVNDLAKRYYVSQRAILEWYMSGKITTTSVLRIQKRIYFWSEGLSVKEGKHGTDQTAYIRSRS